MTTFNPPSTTLLDRPAPRVEDATGPGLVAGQTGDAPSPLSLDTVLPVVADVAAPVG